MKMTNKIEEFNNWCKENKISIGKDMRTESVMIADWWIKRLNQQKQQILTLIKEKNKSDNVIENYDDIIKAIEGI